DHVFALEALHDAGDDFALAIFELVVDLFALGVADVLDEVLLGRLRGNPAHRRGVELDQDLVAHLRLRVVLCARLLERRLGLWIDDLLDHGLDFEQLDLAQLLVVARFDAAIGAEGPARRRMHHLFDRVYHDRLVDPLLLGNLLDYPVKLSGHTASTGRAAAPPEKIAPADEVHLFALGCIKIVFVIRSLYLAEFDPHPPSARLVVDLDAVGSYIREPSDKRLAPLQRVMRLNPDASAAYGFEVGQPHQRPVQSWRSHFERVAPFDWVVYIEQVAEDGAQALEVVKPDTSARPIHQQAQHRAARALVILDRHQLVALALDVRPEHLDDPLGHRIEPYNRSAMAVCRAPVAHGKIHSRDGRRDAAGHLLPATPEAGSAAPIAVRLCPGKPAPERRRHRAGRPTKKWAKAHAPTTLPPARGSWQGGFSRAVQGPNTGVNGPEAGTA